MATAKSSSTKAKRTPTAVASAPRSWELSTWPAEIWPHNPKRAQWIGRAYRKELLAAGAMTRIGMKLVFIGAKYESWLERRANHVVEFQSNNPALGKSNLARRAQEA
jgi:hypothetical protein